MEREVIHLSFGPEANALNTVFYNTQASYFVYNKEDLATSYINPKVRFQFGNQTTPRAAFWDFRNGFNFDSSNQDPELDFDLSKLEKIKCSDAIASSWTQDLEIEVNRKSLFRIPTWEVDRDHPYGKLRGSEPVSSNLNFNTNGSNGPSGSSGSNGSNGSNSSNSSKQNSEREFCLNTDGQEALSAAASDDNLSVDEYIENAVRPILERCDLPDGVNVVTDLDAWGGFSSRLSTQLVDEYPKLTMYTWAITRSNIKHMRMRESRLQNLVDFCENSSLVFPITDSGPHKSMKFFETVALLSSLRLQYDPVSMLDLATDLCRDSNGKANIVDVGAQIEYLNMKPSQIMSEVNLYRTQKKVKSNDNECKSYWIPQLYENKELKINLQVNTNPINLRKLVGRNHELKEQVYDMTDAYNTYDSDSDFD